MLVGQSVEYLHFSKLLRCSHAYFARSLHGKLCCVLSNSLRYHVYGRCTIVSVLRRTDSVEWINWPLVYRRYISRFFLCLTYTRDLLQGFSSTVGRTSEIFLQSGERVASMNRLTTKAPMMVQQVDLLQVYAWIKLLRPGFNLKSLIKIFTTTKYRFCRHVTHGRRARTPTTLRPNTTIIITYTWNPVSTMAFRPNICVRPMVIRTKCWV
jgi:hypothetical protein